MTPEEYRKNGYRMALTVSQQEITRAEEDVYYCYVRKVNPNMRPDEPKARPAVMQLAFILLLQRSAVATRAGAKEKESPNLSVKATVPQADVDNADRLLRQIKTVDGHVSKLVDDICEIYYQNKYMVL